MGWTNPPTAPKHQRTRADRWRTRLGIGALATIGAGALAILVSFLIVASSLSNLKSPKSLASNPVTPAEFAAAASTSSIAPSGCAALVRVYKASQLVGQTTVDYAFVDYRTAPAWHAAVDSLAQLHDAIAAARPYAKGPIATHLQASLVETNDVIRSIKRIPLGPAHGSLNSDLLFQQLSGLTELQNAERLLGKSCGGRLAPTLDELTNHTGALSTTTSSAPTHAGVTSSSIVR